MSHRRLLVASFRGRFVTATVLAVLLGSGCGTDGADQYSGSAPTGIEVYGSCAYCHEGTADRMATLGGHHDLDLKCESCHADLKPNQPGPGHRAVPACASCHTQQATHQDPNAGTPEQCLSCHTPHGSENLLLVRRNVRLPQGGTAAVTFDNLDGLADGSFASLSDPGTGVCEVCHTSTAHYRNDGTGAPHFPFPCYTCHPHAQGFASPQP